MNEQPRVGPAEAAQAEPGAAQAAAAAPPLARSKQRVYVLAKGAFCKTYDDESNSNNSKREHATGNN